MKKIICFFKGHRRGKTKYYKKHWGVQCDRCGYWIYYASPAARLIDIEMRHGFDGN